MRTIALLIAATYAAAQEPGFNTQSRLVVVPVSVTDAKGRPVEGLDAKSFVLLDNGTPRTVTVDTIDTGVAPVALVIAVQTSGISAATLEKVRKVGSMVQPLVTGARGCAALISFHSYVRMLQECTSDPDKLDNAFHNLREGDPKGGRMMDAVDMGVEYLASRRNARRVLLLISESRDRGSVLDLNTIILKAQSAGVTVYSMTYSAFKTAFTSRNGAGTIAPPRGEERPAGTETEPLSTQGRIPIPPPAQRMDILAGIEELVRLGKTKATDALAHATGGETWSFARQQGLESAIARFGADLQNQYVLSFTPADPEPGYHKLEVRLQAAEVDPKTVIRARPGYWSVAR